MADHPHTIDRWDEATGENLIERIAGVSDYLVALETYRAAVKRWPGRQDHAAQSDAGHRAKLGGLTGEQLRSPALRSPSPSRFLRYPQELPGWL